MRAFSRSFLHKHGSVSLILVLFFLTVALVPLTYLGSENPQTINWVEGRMMTGFELGQRGFVTAIRALFKGDPGALKNVIHEEFVNRSMLKNIEAAAADQFPLRLGAIRTAKALDRLAISLAYGFLPDPAIPADMHSEYFFVRGLDVIIPEPERLRESTLRVIDDRISNYEALLAAHPGVNFYTYKIERIQNSIHHPLYGYFDGLDGGQYAAYFQSHQPEGLITGTFAIKSFNDHLKYFYQTDHHLNARGILLAYHQIHEMLQMNYPEISSARTYDRFIGLQGVDFRGTAARKSFYPLRETIFEVVDFALPPHKVYEYDQEIVYGNSADYLAGIYPQDAYFNHYEGFYGGDRGMIVFVFENQPERNLLVFGDSYDNALIPLLASHYHVTYDVDVRYYPDFSLSAFLAEHEVTDILIVGEDSVVFSSRRYQINP
jgi:hypothetical protein